MKLLNLNDCGIRLRLRLRLRKKGIKEELCFKIQKINTKVKEQVQNEDIKTLALASALAFYKISFITYT